VEHLVRQEEKNGDKEDQLYSELKTECDLR
jgi:hypothetical protein